MSERRTQTFLVVGGIGPVIFVATFLLNGAFQPGYSWWHDTISTLSLTHVGLIQVCNFVLYGLLTFVLAAGLRLSHAANRGTTALLVIAGVGLITIGPFRTDPVLGFPRGASSSATLVGTVHNTASLIVLVALPIAAIISARREPIGWAVFAVANGLLALVALGLFFAAVSAAKGGEGGDSLAGLFERLPTLFIGVWQVTKAARTYGSNRHIWTIDSQVADV